MRDGVEAAALQRFMVRFAWKHHEAVMGNMFTRRHFAQLKLMYKQRGWRPTAYLLMIRFVTLFGLFKILRGMLLLKVNSTYLDCPPQYTCGFLSQTQLRNYAQDPENEMGADFLSEALNKGDRCYAILDGDKLAAYSWYSHQQTRIDPADIILDFDPHYVYMYKGLTKPEYRGQRLYLIGMNRALQWFLQRSDVRGMISYVESTNFESLRACKRLGSQIFGSTYLLRLMGRYLLLATPSCRQYGFRLMEAAAIDAKRMKPGSTPLSYPISPGKSVPTGDCAGY